MKSAASKADGTHAGSYLAVDVQVVCGRAAVPDDAEITGWLTAAARAAGIDGPAEVAVRIVGEREGRELNRRYRGKKSATNVLSFPAGPMAGLAGEPMPLGDIVVCEPVVRREAAAGGLEPGSHWAHLLVHGMLHLAGYDHESDDDAELMQGLETRILASRGVADPYAGQGDAATVGKAGELLQ